GRELPDETPRALRARRHGPKGESTGAAIRWRGVARSSRLPIRPLSAGKPVCWDGWRRARQKGRCADVAGRGVPPGDPGKTGGRYAVPGVRGLASGARPDGARRLLGVENAPVPAAVGGERRPPAAGSRSCGALAANAKKWIAVAF